jgi:hypothetical protein
MSNSQDPSVVCFLPPFVSFDQSIPLGPKSIDMITLEEIQEATVTKRFFAYVDANFHLHVEVFESGAVTIEERDGDKITTYVKAEYVKAKDAVNSIKQNISDIESSPRKWKKYLTYILKI